MKVTNKFSPPYEYYNVTELIRYPMYRGGYHLGAAIDHNDVKVPESFTVKAEALSEANDEGEYFWLIQDDATKLYYVITGSHDYTGWDCQSSANISEPFSDLAQLPLYVPEYDNQNRPVREMVRKMATE